MADTKLASAQFLSPEAANDKRRKSGRARLSLNRTVSKNHSYKEMIMSQEHSLREMSSLPEDSVEQEDTPILNQENHSVSVATASQVDTVRMPRLQNGESMPVLEYQPSSINIPSNLGLKVINSGRSLDDQHKDNNHLTTPKGAETHGYHRSEIFQKSGQRPNEGDSKFLGRNQQMKAGSKFRFGEFPTEWTSMKHIMHSSPDQKYQEQ